jgi:hypothetical protein
VKWFRSRHFSSADEFVWHFLETLSPGIIPRVSFIPWPVIEKTMEQFDPALVELEGLKECDRDKLADVLLSSRDPLMLLKCAFRLLGHTPNTYVSAEDELNIEVAGQAIRQGDETCARRVAGILVGLGLSRIVNSGNVRRVLMGTLIGLESNRRKNSGGKLFAESVMNELKAVLLYIEQNTGRRFTVRQEERIELEPSFKNVDFAILEGPRIYVAGEINFYTVGGSKPTEIVRSYRSVSERLTAQNIRMIWVTDGQGWKSMKNALKDAYQEFRNIYNLADVKSCLADDLIADLQEISG